MNVFRTSFPIATLSTAIDYHSKLLFIGSCFSDHIASACSKRKLTTLQNPFGIIYNPDSLAKEMHMHLQNELIMDSDLFENQGLFRHFLFHGKCIHTDQRQALSNMQQAVNAGNEFLQQATHLIITFGTAMVYTDLESGTIVANNHKLPDSRFEKSMLTPEAISVRWSSVLKELKSKYPSIAVLFTLSPVRHIRDGIMENAHSKAVLLNAIHLLMDKYPEIYYFPSYEIMMDDLRDYRFYESDMIHPNEQAIQYIWDAFKEACFDPAAYPLMEQIEALNAAMHHRPFFTGTEQHRTFRKKMLSQCIQLQHAHSYIDLESIIAFFKEESVDI